MHCASFVLVRLQGVLLATCFDPQQLDAIRALAKRHVEVGVTPTGDVAAEVVERKESDGLYTAGEAGGVCGWHGRWVCWEVGHGWGVAPELVERKESDGGTPRVGGAAGAWDGLG